jgi:salicylate hydroxylase
MHRIRHQGAKGEPMTDKPHVLIAGAGIGGLTAALGLLHQGFPVSVYEQAKELREVGAGVLISPNGMRVLTSLGIAERALAVAAHPVRREVRLWNTGQAWPTFELNTVAAAVYGYPFAWLFRPDLLELLADAITHLAPDAIHLGCSATSCRQDAETVTLLFADGRTVSGDALVGADGVHSVVRSTLHGTDQPEFTGFIAWRGVIPFTALPSRFADGVAKTWVGPRGHVVEYPIRRGELLNFVGVVQRDDWRTESWSTVGSRKQLVADFNGWHDDVQIMIEAIPQPNLWALSMHRRLPHWSVDRMTLLGDACHPTLPFLGQGATMAIEDGLVLARAMAAYTPDIARGFGAYEAVRKERTSRLVAGAEENVKRITNPILADPATAQVFLETEFAEAKMSERLNWVYEYDATSVVV